MDENIYTYVSKDNRRIYNGYWSPMRKNDYTKKLPSTVSGD